MLLRQHVASVSVLSFRGDVKPTVTSAFVEHPTMHFNNFVLFVSTTINYKLHCISGVAALPDMLQPLYGALVSPSIYSA